MLWYEKVDVRPQESMAVTVRISVNRQSSPQSFIYQIYREGNYGMYDIVYPITILHIVPQPRRVQGLLRPASSASQREADRISGGEAG